MATNELTGNLDSAVLKELLYPYERYDWEAFAKAQIMAQSLFQKV